MSDFKAKSIKFPLWLRPRPCWGSLQCSPDSLATFKGPTSKAREGKEKGGVMNSTSPNFDTVN